MLPTSRNARGVDIIPYYYCASLKISMQVKSLSRRTPDPLGENLDRLLGDFVIICRNALKDSPECFVLTPEVVRRLAYCGEKNRKVSYWLQSRSYEQLEFRENWERIGLGEHEVQQVVEDTKKKALLVPR